MGIDWNKSESVVKAAIPRCYAAFNSKCKDGEPWVIRRGSHPFYPIGLPRATEELAWDMVRNNDETVIAFEATHRTEEGRKGSGQQAKAAVLAKWPDAVIMHDLIRDSWSVSTNPGSFSSLLSSGASTEGEAWSRAARNLAALPEPPAQPEMVQRLAEAARDVEKLTLLICAPWQWLNDPERNRVSEALLKLRAVLAEYERGTNREEPHHVNK